MKMNRRNFVAMGGMATALGALASKTSVQAAPQSQQENVGHFSKGGPTERADYERIALPYKEKKGVRWPNGARIAAICYIACEYWEANAVHDNPRAKRKRNWSMMAEQSWYNFENAIYRSMDVYEKYGLKSSALLSGLVGKYYPHIVKELKDRGHEIAAHEWDQSKSAPYYTRDEEQESIRRTTETLEKASGVRPVGWINPGAVCSEDTIEFLANENYLWHGDLRDDDLPYGIRYKGKTIVRIPHVNPSYNDLVYYGLSRGNMSPKKGFEHLKEIMEAYIERSKEEAILLIVSVHPFVGAKPDHIVGFDHHLNWLTSQPGIWWCTYKEAAEYWKKTYLSGV